MGVEPGTVSLAKYTSATSCLLPSPAVQLDTIANALPLSDLSDSA